MYILGLLHHISSTPSSRQSHKSTVAPSVNIDTNFHSFGNNRVVYRYEAPSVVHEPLNQLVHPAISYAPASPVLQARFDNDRNLEEADSSNSNSSNIHLKQDSRNSDLSSAIRQYLQETNSQRPNDQVIKIDYFRLLLCVFPAVFK